VIYYILYLSIGFFCFLWSQKRSGKSWGEHIEEVRQAHNHFLPPSVYGAVLTMAAMVTIAIWPVSLVGEIFGKKNGGDR
jgi:hypothetical protein